MQGFIARHRGSLSHGDTNSLSALLNAETAFVNRVADMDVNACAQMVETGEVSQQTARSLMTSSASDFGAVNTALFDAILSGTSAPIDRADVTNEELVDVTASAVELGADETVLASDGTSARYSAVQRCSAGRALFNAMNANTDLELHARLTVAIYGEAADAVNATP